MRYIDKLKSMSQKWFKNVKGENTHYMKKLKKCAKGEGKKINKIEQE